MSSNAIKNVLVLGTDVTKIRDFCNCFESYLLYDSYDEARNWNSSYGSSVFVDKLRLIITPVLEDEYNSKQIITILLNTQELRSISGVIFLLKKNEEDNLHLSILKNIIFRGLAELPDNILYIYPQENEKDNSTGVQITNKFYLNEQAFYIFSSSRIIWSNFNWLESSEFCKRIYNYIVGDENINGLQTIYINNEITKEVLLNLIDNLLELLIKMYICYHIQPYTKLEKTFSIHYIERKMYINDYKRNSIVCYGKDCISSIEYNSRESLESEDDKQNFIIKTPTICHALCNCCKTNKDVTKCLIFTTANETCLRCNCKMEFHSLNYFKCYVEEEGFHKDCIEGDIVLKTFVTFYVFLIHNDKILEFEDIFCKFLNKDRPKCKQIIKSFYEQTSSELDRLESKAEPTITAKDILINLNNLYKIREIATIIPEYIEEIFPDSIGFTVINETAMSDETKINEDTKSKRNVDDSQLNQNDEASNVNASREAKENEENKNIEVNK